MIAVSATNCVDNSGYYSGRTRLTASGKKCVPWRRAYTRPGTEKYRDLARNYCRNPDHDPAGPWCYINAWGRKESCDIPQCITTTTTFTSPTATTIFTTPGQTVVDETIAYMKQQWVKNGIEMDTKEFYHRYAHSVTEFGATARITKIGTSNGYGIWTLTTEEVNEVIKVR